MKNGFQIRHVLPLVLVALAIIIQAVGWSAFYTELKAWQAGIAGVIGFAGLIAAALYHADKTQQRDDRLHATERRLLATTLRAELLGIRESMERAANSAEMLARDTEQHLANPVPHENVENQVTLLPEFPTVVYNAAARDIGMLGSDLGAEVVHIYTLLKNLQRIMGNNPMVPYSQYPAKARAAVKTLHTFFPVIDGVLAMLDAFDPDADN